MSEERTPLDQALDLFVFAPIGLALTARDELPRIIERGRKQVGGQVAMAKVLGQFAVMQGQKEAEKLVHQAAERFTASPAPTKPAAPGRPTAPAPRRDPSLTDEGLAIPGYDSLSASQVLPRLAGLTATELEAVRAYEVASRGRRTILNRIAQLQAG